MLEIKNVQKSFDDLKVLDGIDLTVEKKDVICILGPSGSGKTTLLRWHELSDKSRCRRNDL